jgi:type I restriction enzyme M protein
MLHDLVEHFSALDLTVANLPEDELGQGYEYLIKKFADDSGHTAAEFYTNRTVVHLMTAMLQPQPGESIYDPTCGSGGMLLSAIAHPRRQGQEWRNVRLYGQERNMTILTIMTSLQRHRGQSSSIAWVASSPIDPTRLLLNVDGYSLVSSGTCSSS